MNIDVPDEIVEAAEDMAKDNGCLPQELRIQALRSHFPLVPDTLQAEFDAWNSASDTDAVRLAEDNRLS